MHRRSKCFVLFCQNRNHATNLQRYLKHICHQEWVFNAPLSLNPGTNSWGAYLTYQSEPGCQAFPESLSPSPSPSLGYGWHTPPSTLSSLVQGLGWSSPSCPVLYNNLDIMVTWPFFGLALPTWLLNFWLPTSTYHTPCVSSHCQTQSHVHYELSQMSLPLNSLLFIYNKLPPPSYLGAIMFFLFLSFFHSLC